MDWFFSTIDSLIVWLGTTTETSYGVLIALLLFGFMSGSLLPRRK